MDWDLFTTSKRETLAFIGITILLVGIFGGASVFSILNTNSRNDACRSCRDGLPPNITLGSVVAMPCANNTIIYNSGNRTNVQLNFGIPVGCTGQKGANGSVILSVFGPSTNLSSSPRNTTSMTIYVNTPDLPTQYIDVVGPPGPQGFPGPQGPEGPQGPQGPQGISSPLVLGVNRIITPGTTNLPIPAGATAIYYSMSGAGGGGGGGGSFTNKGCGGGGGASGSKMMGFETLDGVTSVSIFIGNGGQGGASYDTGPDPVSGNFGEPSILSLNPIRTVLASGGGPGIACYDGKGGDGGGGAYGGGGAGTGATGCCIGLPGLSLDAAGYSLATGGFTDGGSGGSGAGPNFGYGGMGNGRYFNDQGQVISQSGGGGGAGGPRLNSGGNGGSFVNSLSGSGFSAVPGSGAGGGGCAGNSAGGGPSNYENSDLIVYGDVGGQGGSGYLDYIFI